MIKVLLQNVLIARDEGRLLIKVHLQNVLIARDEGRLLIKVLRLRD